MFKRPFIPVLFLLLGFSLLPFASAFALAPARLSPLNPVLGPEVLCLPALFLAAFVEGIIVVIGARLRKKPAGRLLLASTLANCITVPALSIVSLFAGVEIGSTAGWIVFLVIAELLIWAFEAFVLRRFPGTQLSWKEALSFSGVMNLASLLAGFGATALLLLAASA